MKRRSKKNNEIDTLARLMKEGFEKIDKQFERVDRHFGKIDQRFDKTDSRLEAIEGKVNALINITLIDVKKRLTKVETRMSTR